MTTAEAKYACVSGADVVFRDALYTAVAIISTLGEYRWQHGWFNSLRLVPKNGARSVTEARMADCALREPMPERKEA